MKLHDVYKLGSILASVIYGSLGFLLCGGVEGDKEGFVGVLQTHFKVCDGWSCSYMA